MSCRIDRLANKSRVTFRVSGRLHAEYVDTLRELLGREKGRVAIDLKEVTLVDRDAETFLAISETSGIELRNCPLIYVNGLIERGPKLVLICRTSGDGQARVSKIFMRMLNGAGAVVSLS